MTTIWSDETGRALQMRPDGSVAVQEAMPDSTMKEVELSSEQWGQMVGAALRHTSGTRRHVSAEANEAAMEQKPKAKAKAKKETDRARQSHAPLYDAWHATDGKAQEGQEDRHGQEDFGEIPTQVQEEEVDAARGASAGTSGDDRGRTDQAAREESGYPDQGFGWSGVSD